MFLYLFRKSLVDFWDHFIPAILYNLLSLGFMAGIFITLQIAGYWWPLVTVIILALGQFAASVLLGVLGSKEKKFPNFKLLLGSLLWGIFGVMGALALGFYWSSSEYFSWFLGFLVFWILILGGALGALFWTFFTLSDERFFPYGETLLSLLNHPRAISLNFLVGLVSLGSVIILLPGPALGLFWSLNTRELILEYETRQREFPQEKVSWKTIIEPHNRELKNRSWLSLIFPWKD